MLDAPFFKIVWKGGRQDPTGDDDDDNDKNKLMSSDNMGDSKNNESKKESIVNSLIVKNLSNAIDKITPKSEKEKEIDNKNMKRVEIKGIEFDWIFTDKEGKNFLDELSETDNMDIFNHSIIKDIIWFQWSKIKPYIIYLQFVPFVLYFFSFLIYTIWSMKNKQQEVEQGP